MDKEIRTVTVPVEIRTAKDGAVKIEGYAAVFDQEANIGDAFREVIRPGAFRNALNRGDDVAFLINHEGLPLARTRSGTLKLSEDNHGLKIESRLDPADPDVARIVPKMKRGDLDKMSFAFTVPDGGQRWVDDGNELDLREITDTMLYDVSIVTEPAFGGTSIALRSRDEAKEAKLQEVLARDELREAEKARKYSLERHAKRAEDRQRISGIK